MSLLHRMRILDRLGRVSQQKLKQIQGEIAEKQRDLNEIHDQQERIKEQLLLESRVAVDHTLSSVTFSLFRDRVHQWRRQLDLRKKAIEREQDALREILREAHREAKTVEIVQDKTQKEFVQLQERAENQTLENFFNARKGKIL